MKKRDLAKWLLLWALSPTGVRGNGDVVLVAGKGHETWQEINGRRLPFSDVVVAEQSLSAWGRA